MEEGSSRPSRKRSFPENSDSDKPSSSQKKVRFPKGKKIKQGDYVIDLRKQSENVPSGWKDPRRAAKERSLRRSQMTTELFNEENRGMVPNIEAAEEDYENNEPYDDDGIQIEPFNLKQEREQGYFDAEGNFVEYVDDKEIKDAWLDSIEVDTKFAGKRSMVTYDKDESELSSEAIGKIKRRIADSLEPGETVLQALRRLKGTSSGKKEKMSAETKHLFDQLTEDAMKLLENGEYNIYDEKQELFQREAEGYERLAQAKGEGSSLGSQLEKSDDMMMSSLPLGTSSGNLSHNILTTSGNGDDTFDMFAGDDDNTTANATSDGSNLVNGLNHDRIHQASGNGDMQNDYVYDESSGYYYSSSLGYYYDPSSGLYCCAASGQWYAYNEETGVYDEVQHAASTLA